MIQKSWHPAKECACQRGILNDQLPSLPNIHTHTKIFYLHFVLLHWNKDGEKHWWEWIIKNRASPGVGVATGILNFPARCCQRQIVLSCLLVSLVLATTCLAHKWNLLPPESYMHMDRHKCILESCPDDPLKPLSAHSIEPQVWIWHFKRIKLYGDA